MPTFQENLWDAITKWIDTQEESRVDNLSSGSVEDWPRYQHEVGYVLALRDVRQEISNAATKLQRG